MYEIRKAVPDDLPRLRQVYARARVFMAATGNPNQWGDSSPAESVLMGHIENGNLYAVCDGGALHGAFAFIPGPDPTYAYIEGRWHRDAPYAAIHCVASDGSIHGMFSQVLAFCEKRCEYLRIDTHHDNRIMQHLVTKHGFAYCGTIYLANGSPRMAYDRVR